MCFVGCAFVCVFIGHTSIAMVCESLIIFEIAFSKLSNTARKF